MHPLTKLLFTGVGTFLALENSTKKKNKPKKRKAQRAEHLSLAISAALSTVSDKKIARSDNDSDIEDISYEEVE